MAFGFFLYDLKQKIYFKFSVLIIYSIRDVFRWYEYTTRSTPQAAARDNVPDSMEYQFKGYQRLSVALTSCNVTLFVFVLLTFPSRRSHFLY